VALVHNRVEPHQNESAVIVLLSAGETERPLSNCPFEKGAHNR